MQGIDFTKNLYRILISLCFMALQSHSSWRAVLLTVYADCSCVADWIKNCFWRVSLSCMGIIWCETRRDGEREREEFWCVWNHAMQTNRLTKTPPPTKTFHLKKMWNFFCMRRAGRCIAGVLLSTWRRTITYHGWTQETGRGRHLRRKNNKQLMASFCEYLAPVLHRQPFF